MQCASTERNASRYWASGLKAFRASRCCVAWLGMAWLGGQNTFEVDACSVAVVEPAGAAAVERSLVRRRCPGHLPDKRRRCAAHVNDEL